MCNVYVYIGTLSVMCMSLHPVFFSAAKLPPENIHAKQTGQVRSGNLISPGEIRLPDLTDNWTVCVSWSVISSERQVYVC